MERCLNIIVYYNNCDEVVEYIENSIKASGVNILDFIVVVNKDSSNQASKIISLLKLNTDNKITLIDYKENIGYLNAMLKVIIQINIDDYSKIILSNTDIKYISNDFFSDLLKKKYNNQIGCIAPNVFSLNSNSFSNPHYKTRISKEKIIKLIKLYNHPFFAKYYVELARWKSYMLKKTEQESQEVYSPHGCYMIFTNQFIRDIKGCLYGVKMYSEESFIGELLIKFNYKCYYDKNLKIKHIENTTTNKLKYKEKFKYMRESLEFILKEFYN